MKIAVFLPNWVGDACMATPAIRALRAKFPHAEFLGIGRPSIVATLAGWPGLDRCLTYHPKSADKTQRGRGLAKILRAERCDTAVLLPNSWRSAWMARLAGIPRRVGYARDFRGILLTNSLPMPDRSVPHSALDAYLRLAEHLGCDTSDRRLELTVTTEEEQAAAAFWNSRSTPEYICLNTGGAFGSAKDWPADYFAHFARRWAVEREQTVVVLCGPAERDTARRIATLAKHPRVLSVAEEPLSLGLSKALVKHSQLLISTDSGPRHFAAAFDVPVVTLFGPTHIGWSETYAPHAVHLQKPVDCGPCQQRVCPEGHHRCMTELPPDLVFRTAVNLLERTQEQSQKHAA